VRLFLVALTLVALADAPRPFLPDVLGSDEHESLGATSPDGGETFLTRSRADFGASRVLVVQRSSSGNWTKPQPLPWSDGTTRDSGASLSADGSLYFTSARATPVAKDDWNVFVVERRGDGWSEPRALDAPVNSDKSECCVVAATDGSLLFASDRNGSWDVLRATRDGHAWRVEPLPGEVNGPAMEWPAWLSPDGRLLLLSSIRPGGFGADDLYVSTATDGRFGAPRNLGPLVNGPGFEDSASLSADLRWLRYSTRPERGTSVVREIGWDAAAASPTSR
jgi:Tol biopolymer transport system component